MDKGKNKYDFITELLGSEKLNIEQKNNILKLATTELKKDFVDKDEIDRRLREIEEKLGVTENNKNPGSQGENTTYIPTKYLNPAYLYSYLTSYNNDDILKGTCHFIDSGELSTINSICETNIYDFHVHYKKIVERFENLNNNYKDKFIDNKMKALISVYLKGGKEWNNTIKINWNSQELQSWVNENQHIPPNLDSSLFQDYNNIGFEFSEFRPKNYFLLEEYDIKTFGKLTQYFKYLFHIRAENSILKICKKINQKRNWETEIDFDYTDINENLELFTNVEKLIETYEKLIYLILDVEDKHKLDKPKVTIGFSNSTNNNIIYFSIHHKNSTYKHTIQDAIERPGQVYKNLITNQINGLCEFQIEADFGNNEFAKLNIWNYKVWKDKKMSFETTEEVKGVKYILIFKK